MSRTFDLRNIPTYEQGPVPLSLAKPNGNMNKTGKIKLMQELEVDSSVNDVSTTGNASISFIIDLMALVQSAVKQSSILFADLAMCLSQNVIMPLDTQTLWLSAQINMICKSPLNSSKDCVEERLSFLK